MQALLASGEIGLDALLFTDLTDMRWLTGFTGSNGWVVVRSGMTTLGTDTRYGDRAEAETQASGVEIVALQNRAALQDSMIDAAGSGEVGLDGRSVSQAVWSQLAGKLELASVDSLVATARETKDEAEIERIEAAAEAADAALAEVEPMLFGTMSATNSNTGCVGMGQTTGATTRSSLRGQSMQLVRTTRSKIARSLPATPSSSTWVHSSMVTTQT
jgi:Xaa-Pro aminopeptidase